jgi:predicted RNase H-like HicB family nuclease
VAAVLAGSEAATKNLEPDTHVVLFTAGFLGRGFDSRRLHQITHMKISVIVHKAEEGGFWAEVPAIPGCATQGETMDELLANVREAIEGCLSVDVAEACAKGDEVVELAI